MRTHGRHCRTETSNELDFVDITQQIQEVLDSSGIRNGQVTVFSPHLDCPIVVNELESGLVADIKRIIDRQRCSGSNGNGSAVGAILGSTSVVLPAVEGRLRMGMWQRVLLVELDAGCERSIIVQIVGD
jgi:secondary thiamine-phosphate synthase enzyme